MFLTRINIFISLCFINVISAENQLKDVLQNEISEDCKRSYYVGKDVEQFQICFGNDIRHLMNNVDATTVNEICELDATRCFKKLGDAVKMCLSPDKYKEIFADPIKAVAAGHTYACSHGGQVLKNFTTRQPHCPYHLAVSHLSDKCKQETLKEELFTQSFHSDTSCGERVKLVTCWANAYDKCKDKIASDFFKNLGINMLEQTPCTSYLSSLKPSEPSNLVMPSSPSTLMKKPKPPDGSDASNIVSNTLVFPILYFTALCLIG